MTATRTTVLFLGGLLLIGVGCGDGAASSGDLGRLCEEECAWRSRCGRGSADCQPHCFGDLERYYANYRSDFFETMADCFRGSGCQVKDDDCYGAGLQSISPNLAGDPAFQQCTTTRAACKARDLPSFSDDYCGSAVALTGDAQDRLAGCYQLACEQMSGCVKGIIGD